VFPARYELNSYIVFKKRLVSKRLSETKGLRMMRTCCWEDYLGIGGMK
jgi:hypothetical protein